MWLGKENLTFSVVQVTAVGHAAILAAIQKYVPALVSLTKFTPVYATSLLWWVLGMKCLCWCGFSDSKCLWTAAIGRSEAPRAAPRNGTRDARGTNTAPFFQRPRRLHAEGNCVRMSHLQMKLYTYWALPLPQDTFCHHSCYSKRKRKYLQFIEGS